MAHEDHRRRHPGHAGKGDVVAPLQRHDLAADDARVPGPVGQHDHHHHGGQAGLHRRGQDQRQRDRRHRLLDLDQPHQHRVHPAAEIPRHHPHQRADAAAEQDGVERHDHRHPRPRHDPAEDIAAEIIRPQRIGQRPALLPRRRVEGGPQIQLVGVIRHDPLARRGTNPNRPQHDDRQPGQSPERRKFGHPARPELSAHHGSSDRPGRTTDRPAGWTARTGSR